LKKSHCTKTSWWIVFVSAVIKPKSHNFQINLVSLQGSLWTVC